MPASARSRTRQPRTHAARAEAIDRLERDTIAKKPSEWDFAGKAERVLGMGQAESFPRRGVRCRGGSRMEGPDRFRSVAAHSGPSRRILELTAGRAASGI